MKTLLLLYVIEHKLNRLWIHNLKKLFVIFLK